MRILSVCQALGLIRGCSVVLMTNFHSNNIRILGEICIKSISQTVGPEHPSCRNSLFIQQKISEHKDHAFSSSRMALKASLLGRTQQTLTNLVQWLCAQFTFFCLEPALVSMPAFKDPHYLPPPPHLRLSSL